MKSKKRSEVENGSRGLSRREFVAGTAAAGIALGMPSLIIGCGSDDDDSHPQPTPTPTPGERPREARTMHFDLSFAELENLRIRALASASHGAALSPHTESTRARFREENPALQNVADERLTHFIEDVDLPSDALQHLWFTGTVPGTGAPAVAGSMIHVPKAAAATMARVAAASGRSPLLSAKLRAYRIAQSELEPVDLVANANDYQTPFDTAASLVFHNPEVMNLDLGQGTAILNLINTLPCSAGDTGCQPFIDTLAFLIAENWPASTSGGWATLVPVSDTDGNPVLDSEGKQVYRYDLAEEVAQAVCSAAAKIKQQIFNDPQFAGTNWHPTEGMTVSQTTSASSLQAAGSAAATAGFAVTAAHPAATTAHGVQFTDISVTDQANRTVELKFRNHYLRYLSTYVQFANEGGDLPVEMPTSSDTERAKFLKWINSNYTVLGIPLIGNDVPLSSVQFNVPADASIAKVYFGSLGLGGEAFSPEALDGSIFTLIFDIGLPTVLLAAGAVASGSLLSSLQDEFGVTIVQVLKASLPLILGEAVPDLANGIFGSTNSGSAKETLISLGNAVITAFFATGEGAAALIELGAVVAGAEIIESIPFLGVALRVAAVAAEVAAIAQSVAEVLESPAIFINQVCLTMTTTVTINKDPNDFRFPATARNYEVILTYDSASKVAHKQTGTIEPNRVDPITVVFDNVPSGGMVTVDVYLTTDTDCIVGRSTDQNGNAGPLGPLPGTQSQISVTIQEQVIPLTTETQYLHELKLEYQDGGHVWVQSAAPTATQANLMEGQDDALNSLTGITISQPTGMVGYAYEAGGQGVPFCGQTVSGIMNMLQNIFLADDPDRGLKQLPCGFTEAVGIVYDKLGPASGMGRNFFLQPTAQGFFLQSITLDDSTPINLNNPLSWGQFSQALDSLAVVPTGYVVGVNRQNHKMEILELPPQAVDASNAPQSVPFSVSKMGQGTRSGLLNAPVAVAVIDAAILILEDGNQRVQAVDVSGNPVLRFQNGTTSIVDLEKGSGIVYLDLGVEGMGYFYVLSFVNDAMTPADYRLDIYDPQGNFLTRTTGVAAARMAVDTFRNVYTLNYETIANAPRIEPSLSQWNPSTPAGCPTPPSS